MIVFGNDEIRRFVEFISEKDVPPVELYIIPGYDALEINDAIHDSTVAFGAYDPAHKRIIVPEGLTDEDKGLVLSTIAHEYFHHIEAYMGVEHNEDSAEAYAADMVKAFKEGDDDGHKNED